MNFEREGDLWMDMFTSRAWYLKPGHWHFVGIVPKDEHLLERLNHIDMPCSEECIDVDHKLQLERINRWEEWMSTANSSKIVDENYCWDCEFADCKRQLSCKGFDNVIEKRNSRKTK